MEKKYNSSGSEKNMLDNYLDLSKFEYVVDYYTDVFIGKVFEGPMPLVNIHPKDKCAGENCVIHNPTDHHMREWKTCWRADKGIIERLCPKCGTFVVDPDCEAWLEQIGQPYYSAKPVDCIC